MRHGKKFNHLGRTASHRKALLANMATSLILNKRINTTVAKAKALRKYIEPLITKAKKDSTNARRVVFSYLQDKESIKELFGAVADKVGERPGGYTRIIRLGARFGDNAEMCLMELVDFNDLLLEEKSLTYKSKTRRSRSRGVTRPVDVADSDNKESTSHEPNDVENLESTDASQESNIDNENIKPLEDKDADSQYGKANDLTDEKKD